MCRTGSISPSSASARGALSDREDILILQVPSQLTLFVVVFIVIVPLSTALLMALEDVLAMAEHSMMRPDSKKLLLL